MDKFIAWLRGHKMGAKVRTREWIMNCMQGTGILSVSATLSAKVFRVDGTVENLGIISTHEVTDDFVELIVDKLQGLAGDLDTFKYHDTGEGSTGEDPTDSALEIPCGDARDAGTQIEGDTANIYKSVATHTYAGAYTITEHGLFNAAAAGVLMDRSVFTGIGVAIGDKIEFTYQLTLTSGG